MGFPQRTSNQAAELLDTVSYDDVQLRGTGVQEAGYTLIIDMGESRAGGVGEGEFFYPDSRSFIAHVHHPHRERSSDDVPPFLRFVLRYAHGL